MYYSREKGVVYPNEVPVQYREHEIFCLTNLHHHRFFSATTVYQGRNKGVYTEYCKCSTMKVVVATVLDTCCCIDGDAYRY